MNCSGCGVELNKEWTECPKCGKHTYKCLCDACLYDKTTVKLHVTSPEEDFRAFRREIVLAMLQREGGLRVDMKWLWDNATRIARAEPKE